MAYKGKLQSNLIKIVSGDNDTMVVDKHAVRYSKLIQTLLNVCKRDEQGIAIVPIYKLNGNLLRKILEWTEFHKYESYTLLQIDDTKSDMCEWDLNYFDVSQSALCDILWAANYLELPPLWKSCCKYVGKMIEARTMRNWKLECSLKRTADTWDTPVASK